MMIVGNKNVCGIFVENNIVYIPVYHVLKLVF